MRYDLPLIAALLAAPVSAQEAEPPAAPAVAQPEMEADRLERARLTASYLFPAGTYQRMMAASADSLSDMILASIMNTRVDHASPYPGPADDPRVAGKTIRELASAHDPHFEERMRIMNRVTMAELVRVVTKMEPQLREALSQTYARKFTSEELAQINAFLSTPLGKRYGPESLKVWVEPEMLRTTAALMPDIHREMPAIMEKVRDATAHLPLPPAVPPPTPDSGKRKKGR